MPVNGHLAYHFFVFDNRLDSGDASSPWTCAEQRGILILKESRLAELPLFATSPCNRRENSRFSSCWQSRGLVSRAWDSFVSFFKRSCYAACRADKENRRIDRQQLTVVDIPIKCVILVFFLLSILSLAVICCRKVVQFEIKLYFLIYIDLDKI